MIKALLIALAVVLFIPNLLDIPVYPENSYNQQEEYNDSLAPINSLSKADRHIGQILAHKKIAPNSYECAAEISSFIRKRFYHGYSHFSINENWLAAVSGKLFDSGMACKVQPDQILLHQNAACSQQAIVMMALLRKKGISYRHITFPHHYALEVLINNNWYFFDPNMEPRMSKEQRMDKQWQYKADSLKKYYLKTKPADLDHFFGTGFIAEKGSLNEIPAPNARLFQATAGILSKTAWSVPLLLLFLRSRKKNQPGNDG